MKTEELPATGERGFDCFVGARSQKKQEELFRKVANSHGLHIFFSLSLVAKEKGLLSC